MPLVMVKRNTNKMPDTIYVHITRYLREWTAEALSVPGTDGELTPQDVEIWDSYRGVLDRGEADLQVVIFADKYPERVADLDKRQGWISRKLATFLKGSGVEGVRGFVWILLQEPTSFGKFQT